jgi:type IV secretory pathway TraG/TraD family ATPase VirD4
MKDNSTNAIEKNIVERTVNHGLKFYESRSETTRNLIKERILPVTVVILLIFGALFYLMLKATSFNNVGGAISGALALTFGVGFWFVLVPYLAYLIFRKKPVESDAHGSARVATDDELIKEGFLREANKLRLAEGEFCLGIRPLPHNPRPGEGVIVIVPKHRAARHGMNVGATGVGKTVFMAIPNIVFANNRTESQFVTDVKGELWEKTSGLRKFPVCIAPLEPERNMLRFNWIPAMKENPILAEKFAQAVVFNRSENKDSHWTQAAVELLQSVWLHTATTDQPNPLMAYEILFAPREQLRHILENSPSRFAREASRQYLDAPKEETGSILSTTRAAYKWMRIPELKEFCNRNDASDFSFMRNGVDGIAPTVYYQAREDEVELLKPLNALFFTYMLWQLKNIDGNTVKFIMDEFANFGKIPNFESEITLLRSRKMPFFIFLQTLRSQLEAIYGKIGTDTILSNLHIKTAFNGLENDDAEMISKSLGEFTNVADVQQEDGKRNTQINARRLMTADEVARMSKEMIVVFQCGELHPFLVKRQAMTGKEESITDEQAKKISKMTRKPLPVIVLDAPPPAAPQPSDEPPPMPEIRAAKATTTKEEPPEMPDWDDDLIFPGDGNIN